MRYGMLYHNGGKWVIDSWAQGKVILKDINKVFRFMAANPHIKYKIKEMEDSEVKKEELYDRNVK